MKRIFLSAIGLVFCMGAIALPSGGAQAQEVGSLAYYPLSEAEYRDNYIEWKNFLEYNLKREPCQNYRQPPEGFVMKGCDVYRVESVAEIQPRAGEVTETTETIVQAPPVVAETSSNIIYFDWDRSNIRDSERMKLDGIIREIRGENPAQITVSGHADRSGSVDYNQGLSERRAETVVDELVSQGIREDIILQRGYGETMNAVPTEDGVRLEENRRAVIEFAR